jgi:hypothetical protein
MGELYPGIAGSPITYLAGDISAGQTTIAVGDDTALPDAPNLCTIGFGENIETIRYGAKSNGVLSDVTRGIEGTPRAWPSGTEVARFFTAYDHNAIIEAHKTHVAENITDAHGFEIEIGTFTPTYLPANGNFGGGTISGQGSYVKQGSLVFINLIISTQNLNLGTASGNVNIANLPFMPKMQTSATVGRFESFGTSNIIGRASVSSVSGQILLRKGNSDSSGAPRIQTSDLALGPNNNFVDISIVYEI